MLNVINLANYRRPGVNHFNPDYALDVIAEAVGAFFVLEHAGPKNEIAIEYPARIARSDFPRIIANINDGTGLKLDAIREGTLPDEVGRNHHALIFCFDAGSTASRRRGLKHA